MFKAPEKYRITRNNPLASDWRSGNNGAFLYRFSQRSSAFIIASDGLGWEHVSVHIILDDGKERTPTWSEMCFIKDLFWSHDDWVLQYHPARTEYVNNHPHTLHLWRPVGKEIPVPLSILVGIK